MSLLPVGFGASGDDYEITDSLRFRSSATAYLSRTPASTGNQKTWTWSGWVKRAKPGSTGYIFAARTGVSGSYLTLVFSSLDDLRMESNLETSYPLYKTNALFRDPSAWYHIVVALDTTQATSTNRLKIYINGVVQTTASYNVPAQNTDLNVNSTATHLIGQQASAGYLDGYLTEVNFIDGQALDPTDFGEYDDNGTWKAKEYTGTYGTNGFYLPMKPTTQAELQNTVLYAGNTNEQSIDGVGYAPDFVWIKNRTGANNHYLYDTLRGTDRSLSSQSTGAESVGGQQLTSFDTDGFTVPYDVSGYNNYAGRSYVAWTWDAGDNQTSTGISSVQYFGQGVAQSVKGFGFSPDLVWIKSRDIAASHILIDSVRGSGFELSSNSIGAETSNGVTRFESIDSDGFTIANTTAASINQQNRNYIAWGWDAGDGDPVLNEVGTIDSTVKANDATGFSIVSYTGNGTNSTVGHGLTSAPAMIIVRARDNNNATNWAVWHSSFSSTEYIFLNSTAAKSSSGGAALWNSTVPSSTVFSIGTDTNPNYNTKSIIAYCFSEVAGVSKIDSYTGNGSTTGPVITTGFRPGFLLVKKASGSAAWQLIDGTRDPFANPASQVLYPNLSDAEYTWSGGAWNFTSTGFQPTRSDTDFNGDGETYIYMAFKGSYSDYVSPLNDDGSIDSRVKANTEKGFSIVSYEGNGSNGATVGHGLSSTPETVIIKDRSNANNWAVYHKDLTSTNYSLVLNSSAAEVNYGSSFIAPASSTLSLANGSQLNASSRDYIAYCFHSVDGYSKINSYTGTGSAGNSVTGLGFQPAWLMIKETTSTGSWAIIDTTRSPDYDAQGEYLWANLASATGGASAPLTFDSDGFTINSGDSDTNSSGQTYIYMAFADTRDEKFNFDASGNKNNFDANNINSNAESETTYDLMKDTPSLVDENAANFATLNPLRQVGGATITDGNLTLSGSDDYTFGTIALPSSGKFYYEMTCGTVGNTVAVGVADSDAVILAGYLSGAFRLYATNGNKYTTTGASSYGATYTTGDVIGVACDMTNNTISFYKNNVSQGTAFTDLADTTRWIPYLGSFNATGGGSINFGQRPFEYTPPTGFLKLNTFNLPDSTIEDGSDYFNTVLYTGNGSTNHNITGVGFQPDWVWLKERSSTSFHQVLDAVRGAGIRLETNSTGAETTPSPVGLSSFDSDGFTVENNNGYNQSSQTYVSWNWKANGSGVLNEVGSIDSTVSANTTAGFSIVSYTGNGGTGSIGHGLGVTPSLVIIKNRNNGSSYWPVFGSVLGNNYLTLNTTSAQAAGWTSVSSSVITFNSYSSWTTENGSGHVAYCFAPVEGYSAFGSYTGNGSTDGTFVYTGFRPAFLIIKRSNAAGSWYAFDSVRSTYNLNATILNPNLADAEWTGTNNSYDFVSNGFKNRGSAGDTNASGSTYIYMAFAENPFKNSNAR